MNTTTLTVLTALIVVAGKWAQKAKIEISTAVGVMVLAIMLAAIETANPKFARALALLALVSACFIPPKVFKGKGDEPYLISIVKGLGFTK